MNYCQTCKHFVAPSWDTGGFGTCYLPSFRKDNKLPPVIKPCPEGWIAVSKTFGCPYHGDKNDGHQG